MDAIETNTLLTRLGATELAGGIAAGDLSAREVTDAHINRIEAVDGALNAIVLPRFEAARQEADAADAAQRRGERLGPLHGVPVTIKDQFHVTGLPTTYGVSRLAENRPVRDGTLVAALRDAGAIVLGKTNVPQGLGLHETVNDLFGRTNNPWDLDRTPGGSSGGEGAIIAAGGAPLGLGADFGGSLRVPAAWCGVSTLKPTARRLPMDAAPVRTGSGAEGIVGQPGPMARSTADVALALRILVDAVNARPTGSTPPVPWREPAHLDVSELRIALLPEIDRFAPSPAVRRALEEAVTALRSEGAVVETWDEAPDTGRGMELAIRLYTADGSGWSRTIIGTDTPHPLVKGDLRLQSMPSWMIRLLATGLGAAGQRRTARLLRSIGRTSADGLMQLLGDRLAYEAAFVAAMDVGRFDAVLCPAMPLPAPRHDQTPEVPDLAASVMLFNLLGMPAGVTPVTRVRPGEESDRADSKDRCVRAARDVERGSAGLPVGVQVVAPHWREDVVLAVMETIEAQVVRDPGYPTRPPM